MSSVMILCSRTAMHSHQPAAASREREGQYERWSLTGATALVTSGSKGIGHAIVEELAAFGARVHTCSRSAADLEACQRWGAEKGSSVTISVCDVAVCADPTRGHGEGDLRRCGVTAASYVTGHDICIDGGRTMISA
ncbi:LOW QUALITY PROTEIN: hypothetical protein SORBI_3005G203150 [Sorghum bicolor]|uniref:Uncharacterized protein n=1 Tax=Sorghum bicolor TaxID=4558 RepID=A0A1Z5RJM7_SORBI|nr:LOW QUALITY PROTEIN: hypothetical protein SORBI_3005G203150 [Sorghum bicolor]